MLFPQSFFPFFYLRINLFECLQRYFKFMGISTFSPLRPVPVYNMNEVTFNNLKVGSPWNGTNPHSEICSPLSMRFVDILKKLQPRNRLKLHLVFFHISIFCFSMLFLSKVSLFFFVFLVFASKPNEQKNTSRLQIVVVDPPAEFKKCV